jgi:ABC-type dipeptide/oligopeptide/nickel transport system permease component
VWLAGFIFKRLCSMALLLLAVSFVCFCLLALAPGDPVRAAIGQHATANTIKQLDHAYGLDLPLQQRYLDYLAGLLHGSLGMSLLQPGQSVSDLLAAGLPVSLTLGGLALLMALVIGVPLGVIAAVHQHSPVADGLNMGLMLALYSVPAFVLIPFAVTLFSIRLHWLPAGQWGDPGWMGIKEAALPVAVYAAGLAGFFARSMRSFMLEVLHQDYIRTARAKGLRRHTVIYVHALKNTLLPFSSVLGPAIAFLVVGSFVVENEFSVNGIGYITVQSTLAGDFAVTEATTLLLASTVVVVNALTDIFYAVVDPRVQL